MVPPDDAPFALIEAGPRGLQLSAITPAAQRVGLAVGHPLADARAAFPGLRTHPAEPEQDRIALRRLAAWAGRYGPARNGDGSDGLWIDITGAAHLFGGEARLAADIIERLAGLGLTACVGLADTYGAAFALARHHRAAQAAPVVAPPGETAASLAALPVEGLRLDSETVVVLRRLGLRRIGDLYGIPRAALEQRFRDCRTSRKGHQAGGTTGRRTAAQAAARIGAVLLRLDQALGRAGEPRAGLVEPPVLAVRGVHAEPLIATAGLEAETGRLVHELCCRLEPLQLGVRRLRLGLHRVDGTLATLVAGTSAPCRDPRHLYRLLAERLAAVDAGFGIDAVVLEACRADPLPADQSPLAARRDHQARCPPAALIDQLASRLGPDRVLIPASFPSHVPERAGRHLPVSDAAILARPSPASQAVRPLSARPPLLLPAPEPIAVVAEVPEGAPVRFTWRRVSYRVAKAAGPERIADEWWRRLADDDTRTIPARLRPRDYYHLEDRGGAGFWVFREGLYQREAEDGAPRWFVHGLFA